jgi:hypothetical protein
VVPLNNFHENFITEDIFSGGKRGQCITHSDLIVAYTGKTKLVKIVDYKLKICNSLFNNFGQLSSPFKPFTKEVQIFNL